MVVPPKVWAKISQLILRQICASALRASRLLPLTNLHYLSQPPPREVGSPQKIWIDLDRAPRSVRHVLRAKGLRQKGLENSHVDVIELYWLLVSRLRESPNDRF